jgi:quinol-cytochrome oxidoreductase complex cytochrome b subunit
MKRTLRDRLKNNTIISVIHHTFFSYPAPINLNYGWNFGVMSIFMLFMQIVTGIFLAMFYIPDVNNAFESVEFIMREVNNGYIIRYLHSNGATMFFIAVYSHIIRGLYYNSYVYPRTLLWVTGVIILLLMIITAFLGYVLPWGQMSLWGATVITNLVSTVPFVGNELVTWLWGSFNVDQATLKKFFSLHFLLPFVILAVIIVHIILLHDDGSNNPLGLDASWKNKIKFSPYYLIKDYFGLLILIAIYSYFAFNAPEVMGHPDNNIKANPMVTPPHIVPEWYFLPFFAILRSFESKSMGVIAMLASILILILVPFLNRPVNRSVAKGLRGSTVFFIVASVFILGYLGAMPAVEPYISFSKMFTAIYFFFFLVQIPLDTSLNNARFEYEQKKKKESDGEKIIKLELVVENNIIKLKDIKMNNNNININKKETRK